MQFIAICDMVMAEIDLDLNEKLIEKIRRTAERDYGDSGEASVRRVIEASLEMRILFHSLAGFCGSEVEEPTTNWEFMDQTPGGHGSPTVQDWLFKERAE